MASYPSPNLNRLPLDKVSLNDLFNKAHQVLHVEVKRHNYYMPQAFPRCWCQISGVWIPGPPKKTKRKKLFRFLSFFFLFPFLIAFTSLSRWIQCCLGMNTRSTNGSLLLDTLALNCSSKVYWRTKFLADVDWNKTNTLSSSSLFSRARHYWWCPGESRSWHSKGSSCTLCWSTHGYPQTHLPLENSPTLADQWMGLYTS
jgi:hypothetical protein